MLKMRKMKDSGIEWIGEIPEGWEVVKAKYLFAQRNEKGNSALVLLSPTQKYGVIPQSQLEGVVQVKENTDLRTFKTIHIGDFVISLRSFQGGFEFSNYEGVCSPAYQVFHATKDLSNDFFRYLFKSDGFISKINSLTVGIREGKNIQYWDFSNMLLALPPKEVQIRSAQYLSAKCTEIDTMLSKTRSSIEEYKKLKQAVITQAVTKGVRGEREMKDSGVEWIGEIPVNWTIQRFARVAEVKSNLVSPDNYLEYPQISPENIEKDSGKLLLPCRTVAEVGVISGNHLFYKGQILYSKIRPKLNKVCIAPFDGLCSADMYPIESKNDTRYIMYCILSNGFLQQVSMITENRVKMPKINQVELSKVLVAIPETIAEQKEIADYLDAKCAEIDGLIAKKEQLVKELEGYKKSLIYEVVTGKREV